jgi:hypothetical protein
VKIIQFCVSLAGGWCLLMLLYLWNWSDKNWERHAGCGCIFWWRRVLLLFFKSFLALRSLCFDQRHVVWLNINRTITYNYHVSIFSQWRTSTYPGPLGGPFIFLKIFRPPQLGPQNILTWRMTTATVYRSKYSTQAVIPLDPPVLLQPEWILCLWNTRQSHM